jgi:site-specific recombinase XerD
MPTLPASELGKKIEDFLDYLEVEKGFSSLTIRNYRHYLKRFAVWFLGKKAGAQVEDITADAIKDYRLYLARFKDAKEKPLSRKTQGYHAIAIRSFLRWLTKNDYQVLAPDKIDLPKNEEREIKFLNGSQVERLLNAPSASTKNGKRDRAILEVLFSTGLRVSELTKLDRDKINLEKREFGVVGKGGKARVVFLSTRASEAIKAYLRARDDHYKPLFIRHKGLVDPSTPSEKMRLTPRSVQRLIKKYSQKIKLPVEVTPHVMRHSFATDLLMAGADLRSVQEMLGHKNVATTQIYTHITNRHLKDIHQAFHGKGGS